MSDSTDPQHGENAPGPGDRDIDEIAGYGAAPEGYLQAPAYALKVMSRQNEIKAKVKEINERLKRVEAERDGAEAQLGQAAIDFGLVPEIAAEIESKVEEAEKSFATAKGRSRQETVQHTEELKLIDEEVAALKENIEKMALIEMDGGERVSSVEVEHRRITGAIKRLQIELRNLEGAAEPDRRRVAQTRHELQELRAEETSVNATLNQLMSMKGELAKLEADRERRVREYEEKQGTFSERTKLASAWRRSKLAVAGRQVFSMDKRPKLLDGERLFGRIEQSREKVGKIQDELELHLRALDAYDAEAFGKARVVAIAAGGIVVVVLLSVLAFAC